MTDAFIEFLQTTLVPLGGSGMFLGGMIEELVAPIPSWMVTMAGGFVMLFGRPFSAAALGDLLFVVALPATLGVVLGALPFYLLARRLGEPAVERFGRYAGLSPADLARFRARFEGSALDESALFIVRAIPFVPSIAVNVLAGILGIPPREFIVFTFLGMLARALIMGAVGWQLGEVYLRYGHHIDRIEDAGLALLILGALGWAGRRAAKRRRRRGDGVPPGASD